MPTTINESGKLVLKQGKTLSLNSLSHGKIFLLNKSGETLAWQKIEPGDNIIDTSLLKQGSYAIRIENKHHYTLSSFEIE